MQTLWGLSIGLVFFAVTAARVTFPFSEILQNYDGSFDCVEGCKVYAVMKINRPHEARSHPLQIRGKDININFNEIEGEAPFDPKIIDLPSGKNYYLHREGPYSMSSEYTHSLAYVVYAVSHAAPNYGAPVAVLNNTEGFRSSLQSRYLTVLSTSIAMIVSEFTGTFPAGYPKIYTTGFDAIGNKYAGTRCIPVYQARSQYNAEQSSLTVFAPIVTIDFGYEGEHGVTVNPSTGADKPLKTAVSSTVYMSPGFIGCPFVGNQMYQLPSEASHRYDMETRVMEDSFTMIAKSFDFSYRAISAQLTLNVNYDSFHFNNHGHYWTTKHYDQGAFKISLSGRRGQGAGWVLQLDFGTEISSTGGSSVPHTETPETETMIDRLKEIARNFIMFFCIFAIIRYFL
ncbi:hypothetical protein PENTCL1PPCAC_19714 [Pristionchus entomophagus]|uniref:Uncharacterized protein n=1 Tax=Pristionchus entomophagus TaxID=358040 RepID=A0AAV5TU83_9BILA|nr:hypothetical protein PENTCL1PPCAC_19714 [Pristionchus entomophagus]